MYNKLTDREMELLFMLSEEAGEIVQAVGKLLRHGAEEGHPDGGPNNRAALSKEIGDLIGVVDHMAKNTTLLITDGIADSRYTKMERANRYTHHQPTSPADGEGY